MRGLAAGSKGYEKYPKLFREKFVFLNEYTTSVQAEHDPRGPEGPYRFQDRSVPVLVIKKWDGETLVQQLGFVSDANAGMRRLSNMIDRAVKKAGAIVPPKNLRPLLKSWDKATKALTKKRPTPAIRELRKIIAAGENRKKFPDGPPQIAEKAASTLRTLEQTAETVLQGSIALGKRDPKAARRNLVKLIRDFSPLKDVAKRARAALAALPKN